MPKLYNKRGGNAPFNGVYIGRPSKWGNPYSHMPDTLAINRVASRDEAVDAYEKALYAQLIKNPSLLGTIKRELGGKDLVCWCAPQKCHGEVLLKIANQEEEGD